MEGLTEKTKVSFTHGRFTYADYSPLEDDRNLVDIVKEFVSLAAKVGKLDVNNKKLSGLASDSDRLRSDIIAALKQIKTSTSTAMDKFHDDHADLLSNELLTKGAVLLSDTKNSLSELLTTTQTGFDEQHAKYRDRITARIAENNSTAASLLQAWLGSDTANLPREILSHLSVSIRASLDVKNVKGYRIVRTAESVTASEDGSSKQPDEIQFSYSFEIDPSDIEFWNFRRTVTDLGIRELLLPVGMKAPVSEKIKQKFRFGSRKDSEVMEEPEFTKADGYFLQSASIHDDVLEIELAKDPSNTNEDCFRITYDVNTIRSGRQNSEADPNPKIDYVPKEGRDKEEKDLLQIAEVAKGSDIGKIRLLGSAVMSRLAALQDPQLVRARGKLSELKIRGESTVLPDALEAGDYAPLSQFLSSMARSYAPYIKRMLEKSSVKGELVIREEVGGGQRTEYAVRVGELQSQLAGTDLGKAVSFALGL